ncbi:MAG: hypothetical protein PHX30_06255 [Candidatus Pacebacteria bacterium]|nr:hypothetical protein [Candidatus Paceibacterota bacterium]
MIVEQEYGISIRRGDRVSVPGGMRAFSYYDLTDPKKIDLAYLFRTSALAQIDIYLSHGAKFLFGVNHNGCGFSPKFENSVQEEAWHIQCLIKGDKVLEEHLSKPINGVDYSSVKRVLMYIIVNQETDLFEKAKIIGSDGRVIAEFTLPEEKC